MLRADVQIFPRKCKGKAIKEQQQNSWLILDTPLLNIPDYQRRAFTCDVRVLERIGSLEEVLRLCQLPGILHRYKPRLDYIVQ